MQTFLPHGLPAEPESISNVTLTNSVNLGETRFFAGEEYVYVFNAGSGAIAIGSYAILSSNSGFSVAGSSITNYDFPIGFVKHSTLVTAGFGWLLTRGFTKVQNGMTSTALVTGDVLRVAANGAVCANGTGAASFTSGDFNGPVLGVVVSSCASGASANSLALAYVRCFGT